MRTGSHAWTVAVLVGAWSGACSPCEVHNGFSYGLAPHCLACPASDKCTDERDRVLRVANECQTAFACVARCPSRSASTCGCQEACLSTSTCRDAWNAMEACTVRECNEVCNRPPPALSALRDGG